MRYCVHCSGVARGGRGRTTPGGIFAGAAKWRWEKTFLIREFRVRRNCLTFLKTAKRVVETRWSAGHDAVSAVKCHYDKVYDALEKLTEPTENSDTRADAGYSVVINFDFLVYFLPQFVGRRSAGGG